MIRHEDFRDGSGVAVLARFTEVAIVGVLAFGLTRGALRTFRSWRSRRTRVAFATERNEGDGNRKQDSKPS